jgi:hypothetical protein
MHISAVSQSSVSQVLKKTIAVVFAVSQVCSMDGMGW